MVVGVVWALALNLTVWGQELLLGLPQVAMQPVVAVSEGATVSTEIEAVLF